MRSLLIEGQVILDSLQSNSQSEFDALWRILRSAEVKGYISQSDVDYIFLEAAQSSGIEVASSLTHHLSQVLTVFPADDVPIVDILISRQSDLSLASADQLPTLSVEDYLERLTLDMVYQDKLTTSKNYKILARLLRKFSDSGLDPFLAIPFALTLLLHGMGVFDKMLGLEEKDVQFALGSDEDGLEPSEYQEPGLEFENSDLDDSLLGPPLLDSSQEQDDGQFFENLAPPERLQAQLLLTELRQLDDVNLAGVSPEIVQNLLRSAVAEPPSASSQRTSFPEKTTIISAFSVSDSGVVDSQGSTSAGEIIKGDRGDDQLQGGIGNDSIFGAEGNDSLDGKDGDDQLSGQAGNDRLTGGFGDDSIRGGSGNDTLIGGEGDDLLNGEDDDDTLSGNQGDDRLYGDRGDDTLADFSGINYVSGGQDQDTIIFSGSNNGVTADLGGKFAINRGGSIDIENKIGFAPGSLEYFLLGQSNEYIDVDGEVSAYQQVDGKDVEANNKDYQFTLSEADIERLTLNDKSIRITVTYSIGNDLSIFSNYPVDATDNEKAQLYYQDTESPNSLDANDNSNSLVLDSHQNGQFSKTEVNDKDVDPTDGSLAQEDVTSPSDFSGKVEDLTHSTTNDDLVTNLLNGGSFFEDKDGIDGAKSESPPNSDNSNSSNVIDFLSPDAITQEDTSYSITLDVKWEDITVVGETGDQFFNVIDGIENVQGSQFDDKLTGDSVGNIIKGLRGSDIINGGAGADTLVGGGGIDTLTGGNGADNFVVLSPVEIDSIQDSSFAPDFITDFQSGVDTIQLTGQESDYIYYSTGVGQFNAIALDKGDSLFDQNDSLIVTSRNGFKLTDLRFV